MSRPKPLAASSLALIAALAAAPVSSDAREAAGRDAGQEVAAPADWNPNDLIFVMPPLRPLTGAAAPVKKKRAAPAQPEPASAGGVAPTTQPVPTAAGATQPESGAQQSPASGAGAGAGVVAAAAAGPLPEMTLVTQPEAGAWTAPAHGFDWQGVGLQDGPAPALVPVLDPLPAAEAGPPVAAGETDTRLSALFAQGSLGPAEVRVADRATMTLPAGRVFLPPEIARKLLGEAGLEWRETMQGLVAPAGGGLDWLAPVELVDDGHVHAEDASSLDADALLAAFRSTLPGLNARRAEARAPAVAIEGWLSPPALDSKRRLSACSIVTAADPTATYRSVNCEAWTLGRESAIKIGLAHEADHGERLVEEIRSLAGAIVFDHGKSYEDFDPATDRAAPYGAADLLIHDVSAKQAPAPASKGEPEHSLFDTFADLQYPLLGAGALLLVYMRMKRQGAQKKPAEPQEAENASAEKKADASPSIVARLTARFGGLLSRKKAGGAASASAQGDTPRADEKRAGLDTIRAAIQSALSHKPADAPENDAEEPISALKKFASRMRGADLPAPAVDPSRAFRRPRRQSGAATALAEDVELAAPIVEEPTRAQAPESETRASPAPVHLAEPALDDLGLIEPGDVVASSALRARQTSQG